MEAWETTCPDCHRRVPVPGDAEAVACPHCDGVFAPGTTPTQAGSPPTAPADPDDRLVGTHLGDWTLVRLLGRGGMGRVYEARDAHGRRVALKLLAEDLVQDAAFVRRFEREARVLASLTHPHVVGVLDQGRAGDHLWFTMEHVEGENLRRRLARGPLPPAEAVRIAQEVASALAYAHGRGIVHRDLKPENVLLDADGHVHLADFGLSRLVRTGDREATTLLTRTDVILGTYEYMAPEQRRGAKDVDARADLFALGVILYEMLTGVLPHGRFARPSELRPDVPSALDAIVDRLLATDREARPDDAETLIDDLEAALADVSPAPEPAPDAIVDPHRLRPVLRHVEILAALDKVVGLLAVLVGFGFVSAPTLGGVLWAIPAGGIVLLVGGFFLMGQGKRLGRMQRGARERQIVASVCLLFFPPLGTALGIYGLIVLTSDRARHAFRVGRRAIEGPPAAVEEPVVHLQRPVIRKAPSLLLRLGLVATIVWTAYVFLLVITVRTTDAFESARLYSDLDTIRMALSISAGAFLVSLVLLARAFQQRRSHRGLGMALTITLLLGADATLLSRLPRSAPPTPSIRRSVGHVPPADALPSLPSPLLEIRR